MAIRRLDEDDPALDDVTIESEAIDTLGLSAIAEATDESVEELADEGQDIEADIVQGIEDAADHPERPVPMHVKDPRPPGPEDR